MSKKTKQWFILTEDELGKLVGQGTYPGAKNAVDDVRRIKESGHTPAIYYSDFNGFRIIDEDNPKQFEIGQSIKSKARRFQI